MAHDAASGVEFGTFEKSALPEQICARLLSLIEERRLRPGDRLPPERELATIMGVSRPSLREALRALSMMKVIEMRQGDGTYVSSLEPALLVEHLDFVFSLDDSTFFQLFQARRALEPEIVALAAALISDEELARLEQCLLRSVQTMDNVEAFLTADLELHRQIIEAARNPILSRFMAVLTRLGIASRRRTVELPGIRAQTVADHRAIVGALKSRNPEAARQAMLQHLTNIEHRLQATSQATFTPNASQSAPNTNRSEATA